MRLGDYELDIASPQVVYPLLGLRGAAGLGAWVIDLAEVGFWIYGVLWC